MLDTRYEFEILLLRRKLKYINCIIKGFEAISYKYKNVIEGKYFCSNDPKKMFNLLHKITFKYVAKCKTHPALRICLFKCPGWYRGARFSCQMKIGHTENFVLMHKVPYLPLVDEKEYTAFYERAA